MGNSDNGWSRIKPSRGNLSKNKSLAISTGSPGSVLTRHPLRFHYLSLAAALQTDQEKDKDSPKSLFVEHLHWHKHTQTNTGDTQAGRTCAGLHTMSTIKRAMGDKSGARVAAGIRCLVLIAGTHSPAADDSQPETKERESPRSPAVSIIGI
ncbi:hypothetical protein PoB_003113700 [Plakobranchus ocellatus]|uniref:Uncharacterized protein n=1 Tax=Plakobranchus ocellatus TaxID=259542 RepID=A0AAV4ACL3_9GAST|nr:hypothetical protein PoB_003113700 [Plakobranchus ocellatus]